MAYYGSHDNPYIPEFFSTKAMGRCNNDITRYQRATAEMNTYPVLIQFLNRDHGTRLAIFYVPAA